MTIKFICVGRSRPLSSGAVEDYLKRLRHYTTIEYREIKAEKRKNRQ